MTKECPEQGTPARLKETGGLYARMLALQSGDAADGAA